MHDDDECPLSPLSNSHKQRRRNNITKLIFPAKNIIKFQRILLWMQMCYKRNYCDLSPFWNSLFPASFLNIFLALSVLPSSSPVVLHFFSATLVVSSDHRFFHPWISSSSSSIQLPNLNLKSQSLFTCQPEKADQGLCHPRGGYSSMIWVGTCRWDLKSRPIFIPNFAEKWDPFLYQSHKF